MGRGLPFDAMLTGVMLEQVSCELGRAGGSATARRHGFVALVDELGAIRPFGAIEEEAIRFAVLHYDGRMSAVARSLGIGRSTLYRKLKDYGIVAERASAF